MQLKACGEIKNISEGRKICLNSSRIEYYDPEEFGLWDSAYQRFQKLI
jgi:hypothetical protein